MITNRFILSLEFFVFALCGCVFAVEFVELNDANRAILNLDRSKALESVQNSLASGYKFNKVHEAIKFVQNCEFLRESMAAAKDSDYQGLAAQIKAVLAEPSLVEACKVKPDELAQFAKLDEELGEFSYLTKKKFVELTEFAQSLRKKPQVNVLLRHLFEKTVASVGQQLLADAASDVNSWFNEVHKERGAFDFETRYKSGCEISVLKPLCKLVRRSPMDGVSAIGKDFAEFADALDSGDESKLELFELSSGVSLQEAENACDDALRGLRAMERVHDYKKADMLGNELIYSQCQSDPSFDLYYNMYDMCVILASRHRD